MLDQRKLIARSAEVNTKVVRMFQKRLETAQEHLVENCTKTADDLVKGVLSNPQNLLGLVSSGGDYVVDSFQRWILFWDTMRQRGNRFIEHERAGKPPVLHFDYETVLDARNFERPVNYALLRLVPPKGVTTDPKRRPYIIIDPRAGHGPGIGGFKDDSQAGVALRAGHPVYFVIFFPEPEPGQTLLDVTAAEQVFLRKVRELHPQSPKPVLLGNCQGGWAAMMLAGASAKDVGPIVINGAPMSYWGGAWSEGEGDNPMRYLGGLLGGTWLATLGSDLGNGIFDGAWLVENFEYLNPANSLWDKYYHLYSNVDTEPPRFLEFERWWGGYYLLNREEMDWITQNLFVGNKIWSGAVRAKNGEAFDLRQIQSPIVLFASLGDNITPPQQAFNWVADIYKSTDELKANGQVIVGLLHKDIGHLGIFVSGRVAKKEHTQIVSVLKCIEALPPGLYGMEIDETATSDGKRYEVQLVEHTLEEIGPRLNRFKRVDEKPFEVVEHVSEFFQRGYELFGQPIVQAMSTEFGARLSRMLNPLRVQHWAISDLNPCLAWLGPTADQVRANRRELAPEAPPRQLERVGSTCISTSLDLYRHLRDAVCENLFFQIYGNLFVLYFGKEIEDQHKKESEIESAQLPFVKEALASIEEGGYPEAVARIFALLARHGMPMPLARLELRQELAEKYARFLPDMPRHQQRQIRGEQDIIVRYQPERALETLPKLLAKEADRRRVAQLLDRLLSEEGVKEIEMNAKERELLNRILDTVGQQARAAALVRNGRKTSTRRSPRKMQPA